MGEKTQTYLDNTGQNRYNYFAKMVFVCAPRNFAGAKERNDLNMANMKKEYKMSAERKEELQKELLEGGYPGSTPVAVVFKASWPDERIYHCTVDTLHKTVTENDLTRTSLIIVGDCMGEKYQKSFLYDPSYERPFHEAATKCD